MNVIPIPIQIPLQIPIQIPIQIGIIYNVRHCYAIRLKFGDKFLTFLTKLVLEGKPVSALQAKKIYFHTVVSFRHLFSLL